MEDHKTFIIPHAFMLSHHNMIASLTLLLDKSDLTNAVKKHCITAFKVIGIIYADMAYNTGTHLLSREEFDTFFKLFPAAYFNNRELISVDTITKNIKACIKTNEVVAIDQEGTKTRKVAKNI